MINKDLGKKTIQQPNKSNVIKLLNDNFKIPKISNFKQPHNVVSYNTSDYSNLSDSYLATNNPFINRTIKPLKDEIAVTEQSTKLNNKLKLDIKLEAITKPDGYSLSTSPILNINQNLFKTSKLDGQDQIKLENNKKRINLIKKTTLVQDLENLQAQPNELSKLQAQNEHNFDLGLVPIDIYATSDYETAERIVEARGYILQERIGSGAFANVYKAWHTTEQMYTACKIIELKKKKRKRLNDLKHELYVLDKMDHVNIIKLYEHFLIDEKVYIFLEYASCGTLSEYVRKRGPLKENRTRKWFKQICSGLYHLHMNGISHRDLKLGNILIDDYRNCKITDFGLSRVSYRKGYGIFYCTSYCGTEAYMSPEIIRKDEFGKRFYDPLAADIWALGVCLYAMVNKAYPFNPEDKELMVNNQMQRKWKFVKKQRNKLSNDLKDLIRNLLEPEPKRRITFLGIASHSWMNDNDIEIKSPTDRSSISTTTTQTNDSNVSAKLITQTTTTTTTIKKS